MSRTPEVEAAMRMACEGLNGEHVADTSKQTVAWTISILAAEVERLEGLLARLDAAETRLKRLESAQGDWVPGLKCTKCHGTGENDDARACSACGGTGDVWMTWQQRAEAAEAQRDGAYLERNRVVAALAKCFPSRVAKTAIEGWDPAWHNCVYIDLPTGQASWHYHDREEFLFTDIPHVEAWKWDGHTTEEKYQRIAALPLGGPAEARVKELNIQISLITGHMRREDKTLPTWAQVLNRFELIQAHNAKLRAALEQIAEMEELDPMRVLGVIKAALADTKGTT